MTKVRAKRTSVVRYIKLRFGYVIQNSFLGFLYKLLLKHSDFTVFELKKLKIKSITNQHIILGFDFFDIA